MSMFDFDTPIRDQRTKTDFSGPGQNRNKWEIQDQFGLRYPIIGFDQFLRLSLFI